MTDLNTIVTQKLAAFAQDLSKDLEGIQTAPEQEPKKQTELQHVSIRLHPDLVRQLKEYAEREHRMFSETVRDLLLTGMRERGIK